MPRLLPLFLVATLAACEDQLPTSLDAELLPVGPVSVEVRLPWSQFATKATVFNGFGRAEELEDGFIADKYGGRLDAHSLMHFAAFPTSATVADTTGTTVTDDSLAVVGATLTLRLNRASSSNTGPVLIAVSRTLTHWDSHTATWQLAVDSAGGKQPWPQAGGGPVVAIGQVIWTPEVDGDSVLLSLDSVTTAGLIDTTLVERGLRISLVAPGHQVAVRSLEISLSARPSVHPDTLISLKAAVPFEKTFIYNPAPAAPTGLRVGGIPSARTVITLALPATVPGTPAACAIAACPLALTPERLNHATLVLTSRESEAGFRPVASLRMQALAVLAPEVLPKSPLGPSVFRTSAGFVLGSNVAGSVFAAGGSRTVEVPITPLVEDLMRGTTDAGGKASPTIAILSFSCSDATGVCIEPEQIGFGTFAGVGQPGEPHLRLILTISNPVGLP